MLYQKLIGLTHYISSISTNFKLLSQSGEAKNMARFNSLGSATSLTQIMAAKPKVELTGSNSQSTKLYRLRSRLPDVTRWMLNETLIFQAEYFITTPIDLM